MSAVVGPYWAYSNASLTMLQWQKFYIGGITDPNSFMKQLHQLLPFPELIADLRPSPPIGYSLYVTTPYGWGVHQAMQLSIALASMGPTISQRLLGTHSFHLPVELGPGVFRMTKWVEGGEIVTKFEGDLDRSKIIGESHVLSPPAQAFAAPQTLPLPPTPQGYISSASEYPSPQTFNPAMDQQRPHSFPTTEVPNPPQGSNPGQGYNPAQGYNPGQGYNTAPQGYNPSQGYGPPQSHSPARVHSPAQGYNPSQGYPPAQGYSSPRPYTPSQPYNAPQQPHGYAPPQTYSPSQGYNRYNAPLPYLPGRQFSPGPGGSAPPSPLVRDMRPAVAHWLQHI